MSCRDRRGVILPLPPSDRLRGTSLVGFAEHPGDINIDEDMSFRWMLYALLYFITHPKEVLEGA